MFVGGCKWKAVCVYVCVMWYICGGVYGGCVCGKVHGCMGGLCVE